MWCGVFWAAFDLLALLRLALCVHNLEVLRGRFRIYAEPL